MVKAEGIIIRTTDYGESNKIVTLYTETFGKIGLMARGAKKPRNALSAASHVLFYGLCLFNKGRGLGTLYQTESVRTFREIMSDIVKTGYAAVIVELIDRLTEEGVPSPGLYHLLRNTLLKMESGVDPAALAAIFSIKMMRTAGIDPEVERCIRCGRHQPPFVFSVSGGGFLCSTCSPTDPYALPMSERTAKLFPVFKKVPIDRIGRISLKRETIREMNAIITAYYEQNAGIKLRSKRFIDQMLRMEEKSDRGSDA